MKTWKRIILFSVIGGLTIFCLMLIPALNGTNRYINYLHYIVWGNSLYVSCDNKLDKTKIKLVFENEFALLENRNIMLFGVQNKLDKGKDNRIIRKIIYENGKQIFDIPYDYGKQTIAVFYDDKKVGELGIWRTNHYHVHSYDINLKTKNNEIYIESEIKGPDADFYLNKKTWQLL